MTDSFKPVEIKEYYIQQIADGLTREIFSTMFKPIFELLNSNNVLNNKNTLLNAIKSGHIYYENGAFKSKKPFSNGVATELEKLGAKYKYGAYYLDKSAIPFELYNAITLIAAQNSATMAALDSLLLKLAHTLGRETAVKLFIHKATENMFKQLQVDLEASTSEKKVPVVGTAIDVPQMEIPDDIYEEIDTYYRQMANPLKKKIKPKGKGKGKDGGGTDSNDNGSGSGNTGSKGGSNNPPIDSESNGVKENPLTETESTPPKIDLKDIVNDKRAEKLANDYIYNMDYWVKNWKAKEIVKMRRTVKYMEEQGQQLSAIQEYFQKRWGIAEKKAKFLARNESGIAGSVLKAVHYNIDMGCENFEWLESVALEKRELHLEYAKKKNNKYGIGGKNVFSFANPPIIEQIKDDDGNVMPDPNGKRGLPRQTYNCLCNFVGVKDAAYFRKKLRAENAKNNIFTKIKYTIENSVKCKDNPWKYRRLGQGSTI